MTGPRHAPSAGVATLTPALEIRSLDVGYERTTILRDVSLTVGPGEVTALLGPNGAGKTTLLRAVSGFLPPSAGQISMLGTDVTRMSPHRRAAAGLCHVPEGRGIFRSLTVRENLVMQAPRGREKECAELATQAFPVLGERIGQVAGTLSGGQQQMLAMASAYVREPKVILVDEASLGLAPRVVDEIFEFLQRVTAGGTALLIVDQFATRALAMATRAYVLTRGEISFAGAADELLDDGLFSRYLGQ